MCCTMHRLIFGMNLFIFHPVCSTPYFLAQIEGDYYLAREGDCLLFAIRGEAGEGRGNDRVARLQMVQSPPFSLSQSTLFFFFGGESPPHLKILA